MDRPNYTLLKGLCMNSVIKLVKQKLMSLQTRTLLGSHDSWIRGLCPYTGYPGSAGGRQLDNKGGPLLSQPDHVGLRRVTGPVMFHVLLVIVPGNRTQQTRALIQCCFNVGPASKTVGRHWNKIDQMPRVCRMAVNIRKNGTLTRCCFNAGQSSQTLSHH